MDKDLFRREMNFRELGGYITEDGRRIPYGLFYRSAGLPYLTEDEKKRFETLNIRFILDLRTSRESIRDPDPVFPGVTYLNHSGIQSAGGDEIDFSPAGMRKIGNDGEEQLQKLTEYYRKMPFQNEAFHVLIENVRMHNVPLLFHCAAGKDRTGIASALLLLLLGTDEETAVQDYLLSNEYRKELIEEEKEISRELIAKDPARKRLILMLQGVDERIIREVLSSIKERYGNYEEYFRIEHGIDEEALNDIRDFYLIN